MLSKTYLRDFVLYLFVGGIATIAEWIIFYLMNNIYCFHYMIATIAAYIFSTFVNWLSGRLILFKKTNKNILLEIFSIYVASIVGLILNLLIMWVTVDLCHIHEMISKVIATGLVFIWNFLIRKLLIYKE